MDGIHDMGGKHGYGPVVMESDEPAFHERWEAAVFAMVPAGAAAGAWNNTDRFRHAIERIDPVAYLSHGYYGRWLGGIESLLVEAGVVTTREISERAGALGAEADDLIAARPDPASAPLTVPGEGPGSRRAPGKPPVFRVGDRVLTSTRVKAGHTRLPAYARGKQGKVVLFHDGWVYPDTNAHGEGENPCYLYTVQFTGEELWGGGDSNIRVSLDLFEPYLEKLPAEEEE